MIKQSFIDKSETALSVRKQCEILGLNRNKVYSQEKELSQSEIEIMNKIDEIYTQFPFYGYRRIWKNLLENEVMVGRDRTLKYMQIMGLCAIYPKKTTIRNKKHKVYPYLLKTLDINRPNQVWATDITYIKMERGFCYLTAIIDWYSRKILSYKLSNCLSTDFCIEALEEALLKYPKPEIFNTDQGCQFTSEEFTKLLLQNEVKISMDSKGRATDNAVIERFWRNIKYENIYLNKYQTIKEVKEGTRNYIEFYNQRRLHSSLDYKTPHSVYFNSSVKVEENQCLNFSLSF